MKYAVLNNGNKTHYKTEYCIVKETKFSCLSVLNSFIILERAGLGFNGCLVAKTNP